MSASGERSVAAIVQDIAGNIQHIVTAEIRMAQEIAAQRHELGSNLHELEARARALGDWRAYYRRHPALMLGLALGGGVALGAISARGPKSRPSQVRDCASTPRAF